MARFLFLWSTFDLPEGIADPPRGHEIELIDQYAFDDMPEQTLHAFDGLIVSMAADQHHLMSQAARLDRFLDHKAILFGGPVNRPLLPELAEPFRPLPRRSLADLAVTIRDHGDIFAGVENRDLTYTKGVAGFWGRGVQPAPGNARILTALGEAMTPFDWCLVRPGGGRLFVHPGNDIWTFGVGASSADRIFGQALNWLAGGK